MRARLSREGAMGVGGRNPSFRIIMGWSRSSWGGGKADFSRDSPRRRRQLSRDRAVTGAGSKMAAESDLGKKWDRCLADSAVKLGKGRAGPVRDPGAVRSGPRSSTPPGVLPCGWGPGAPCGREPACSPWPFPAARGRGAEPQGFLPPPSVVGPAASSGSSQTSVRVPAFFPRQRIRLLLDRRRSRRKIPLARPSKARLARYQ